VFQLRSIVLSNLGQLCLNAQLSIDQHYITWRIRVNVTSTREILSLFKCKDSFILHFNYRAVGLSGDGNNNLLLAET
jgi:hypothetical protein